MRVFVVGTGRCGSTTFFKACQYVTNYKAHQESIFRCKPDKLLTYCENHIEISPPMWLAIPRLRSKYSDALIVHLRRNREDCVQSLARLKNENRQLMLQNWGPVYVGGIRRLPAVKLAEWFYDCTTTVIEQLQPDMTCDLESIIEFWPEFWERIQAEGNYDKALKVLGQRFNTGESRGEK